MNILAFLLGIVGIAAAGTSGGASNTATSTGAVPQGDQTPAMDDMSGMDHDDHDMPMPDMLDMPDMSAEFADITSFGEFHGTSSHTMEHSLHGGRTAITTEAMVSYNALREFLGLNPVDLETVGRWAFDNDLTNNDQPYGEDLSGVGLYYGLQGAKAGWISDEEFDPQLIADIQKLAREDETQQVMDLVETYGHDGYATFLQDQGLVETFMNTLKMEPHYGGWMHGRTHGDLAFADETGTNVATAHDLNHLTVLSHDQSQPFMNDTFDWPQWPALEVPAGDVLDYFQSMVTLGDPRGEGIEFASSQSETEIIMQVLVSELPESTLAVNEDEAEEDLVMMF